METKAFIDALIDTLHVCVNCLNTIQQLSYLKLLVLVFGFTGGSEDERQLNHSFIHLFVCF